MKILIYVTGKLLKFEILKPIILPMFHSNLYIFMDINQSKELFWTLEENAEIWVEPFIKELYLGTFVLKYVPTTWNNF